MRIAAWVRRPFSAFVGWWTRTDPAGEAGDRAGERELRWWGQKGLCGGHQSRAANGRRKVCQTGRLPNNQAPF
jgi:hypothetical protein